MSNHRDNRTTHMSLVEEKEKKQEKPYGPILIRKSYNNLWGEPLQVSDMEYVKNKSDKPLTKD